MKKHYLLLIFLFFSFLPVIAQVGFLGKRVHFQFESKFTPAWNNLNFNGKQGLFCFNYHLMPSVEYVFADKWSVSAHYQYSPTAFNIQNSNLNEKSYVLENRKRYYGYEHGTMTVHGCGINILRYFGDCAPAGYYMKLGVDAFFYDISAPYSSYDSILKTGYKEEYVYYDEPGVYTARDWTIGVRFEIGRNFFVGRYVSLGTSLSCGILCKGWGSLIYIDAPPFIDFASRRLLTSYIGGISIKIGFLPF
ncbi:MAG: hypothetical protein FWC10_07695 [Lentimicrobiaceae bacterium]|nr:hypothetical protein [Lentimicrobiaceae bacterium]